MTTTDPEIDRNADGKPKISSSATWTFERPEFGRRRFGAVNWLGLWTLAKRETLRFLKVYTQTLLAPIATAALFLLVFTIALAHRKGAVDGVPYEQFLAPGVIMMTVIQNAFSNTSSSIIIAKIQGNIVDSLTPPLSAHELIAGFTVGAVARGALIALLAALALFPFVGLSLAQPFWALLFTLLGATQLALIGLAAGVWAAKFDHLAAITNFVVTPLAFLSGTFYSAMSLPEEWRAVVWANPVFYLIDGFRYGVLGRSDADPVIGAAVSLAVCGVCYALCWRMFATGYRLKS